MPLMAYSSVKNMQLPENLGEKIFKGCGCISICIVAMIIFIIIVGICVDDEEQDDADEKPVAEQQAQPVKTDSIVVNEPMKGDPYKELDELIGLEQVKDEVHSLANFVKVQKQREAQGLKIPKMSLHLVFTGSPGTGKTTVARIVARIYKDLGVLKKGHTVEVDRSGLVANYVGQTATKTNAVIDSALNGVLFVDEAYALVPNNCYEDYGAEAISTLLKRMEDDRDSLVVIIAGYPKEMKRFINSNPGLQSRFNRYIDFPDYTGAELYDIFCMYVKKNQYQLSPEAAEYMKKFLDYTVAHKDRNFGNARFARNYFEKSIQRHANRLANVKDVTKDDLTTLKLEDVKSSSFDESKHKTKGTSN